MYSALSGLLEKPAIYTKTPGMFWNDPHISKGMLEAHLDLDTDAASRKPAFIDRSVDWIVSLLPAGAKLLDIGCGPGLYTSRFAQRGLQVTGLDFSERSVAYARAHDPHSAYVVQDYLAMEYIDLFDAITLIWCDYGALTPEDRVELVQRVYRALKPGGLFLLDVFTNRHNQGRKEDTSWVVHPQGGFWSVQPHITLHATYCYGKTVTLDRHVVIDDQGERAYNIWNTCFAVESLLDEIEPAGFTSIGYYADVAGTPYSEESTTLCVVFRK